MKAKYKESAPEMEWLVMDVMDMRDLPDTSFDIAIDKGTSFTLDVHLITQLKMTRLPDSGTMDAIMVHAPPSPL